MNPPHTTPVSEPLASYRGHFWIPGEADTTPNGTFQKGPLFVQWEVLDPGTRKPPLVLVHGGGSQGLDWISTVDHKPGWAYYLVRAGYPVYIVDRVGHGRSPFHPDVLGPMGGAFPYEAGVGLFAPPENAAEQTQWPWGREPGDEHFDQLIAGLGPLPADLGYSQELDAERLARLLDRVGASVLVTHSAGGPVGWLTADRRPDLVTAIVAVEPMGPEFVEFPGMGTLSWGLTSAPITFDPPLESPEAVRTADPAARRIPALADKDIAVVIGGASTFTGFSFHMVETLKNAGANPEYLYLPDHGVNGNGHALPMEPNAEHSVKPVLEWLRDHVG